MTVADYPDWTDLVNIVGTDIMVAIDLQGAYIMMPVDLQAQYITLDINIAASAVTLNVNISSQTANLNVNLAASAVTIDINIAASAVTINIATSSTQNIVIDKLVQDAYLGRTFTASNDNGVVSPDAPPSYLTAATLKGKFFPRGCRGLLRFLYIYCKRTASGSLSLSYSPQPGMAAVGTVALTPGSSWDWKSADVEKMWNYDSLFIWVSACSADVSWGQQATEPYDLISYGSTLAWWYADTYRYFIRALIQNATIGDIPVSGTVNNVPIPAQTSRAYIGSTSVPEATETTLVTVTGSGYCDLIRLTVAAATGSELTYFRIYLDGYLAFDERAWRLNGEGHVASTPGISLTAYGVDALCNVLLTKRWDFRREFKLAAYSLSNAETCYAEAYVTKIV